MAGETAAPSGLSFIESSALHLASLFNSQLEGHGGNTFDDNGGVDTFGPVMRGMINAGHVLGGLPIAFKHRDIDIYRMPEGSKEENS